MKHMLQLITDRGTVSNYNSKYVKQYFAYHEPLARLKITQTTFKYLFEKKKKKNDDS